MTSARSQGLRHSYCCLGSKDLCPSLVSYRVPRRHDQPPSWIFNIGTQFKNRFCSYGIYSINILSLINLLVSVNYRCWDLCITVNRTHKQTRHGKFWFDFKEKCSKLCSDESHSIQWMVDDSEVFFVCICWTMLQFKGICIICTICLYKHEYTCENEHEYECEIRDFLLLQILIKEGGGGGGGVGEMDRWYFLFFFFACVISNMNICENECEYKFNSLSKTFLKVLVIGKGGGGCWWWTNTTNYEGKCMDSSRKIHKVINSPLHITSHIQYSLLPILSKDFFFFT